MKKKITLLRVPYETVRYRINEYTFIHYVATRRSSHQRKGIEQRNLRRLKTITRLINRQSVDFFAGHFFAPTYVSNPWNRGPRMGDVNSNNIRINSIYLVLFIGHCVIVQLLWNANAIFISILNCHATALTNIFRQTEERTFFSFCWFALVCIKFTTLYTHIQQRKTKRIDTYFVKQSAEKKKRSY